MGYATGQFGKNHLGDLNEYLPTVHGFDEFFGYMGWRTPVTATIRQR
jgi:arylsulfatase